MWKKTFLYCEMVMLKAAAADPLEVLAEGFPLASPTPCSTQRVTAPEISGIIPKVALPEGEVGDFTPSGGFYLQKPLRLEEGAPLPAGFFKEEWEVDTSGH